MRITFILALLLLALSSQGQQVSLFELQPPQKTYENVQVMPLESDKRSSVFVIWVKKAVPAHYHRKHTEQVMILEGEGLMQLGEKEFRVAAGDFITIPKGEVHAVQVLSEVPLKVLSVQSPRFRGKDRVMVKDNN